jgi:hypothetical protein
VGAGSERDFGGAIERSGGARKLQPTERLFAV